MRKNIFIGQKIRVMILKNLQTKKTKQRMIPNQIMIQVLTVAAAARVIQVAVPQIVSQTQVIVCLVVVPAVVALVVVIVMMVKKKKSLVQTKKRNDNY